MKILFLCPSYFPIRGGTEQVIHELAARLKPENEVAVVTIRWEKSYQRCERVDGVTVHRVGYWRVKGLDMISKCLALFFKTMALSRRGKFDVVHMFHVLETGCAAFLIKKILRRPLVITLAGWETYDPHLKLSRRQAFIVRTAMRAANLVTAPSRFQAAAGRQQGYEKDIIVVPHGGSMPGKAERMPAETKKRLGLEGKRVLLSVQRLQPRKGLADLLAAVPSIVALRPEAHFLVVGEGPEEENLKAQARALGIEEHLTFAGFVADADLPTFYAAADLFVLPTLYEAFGLVYVDALSFGLPVVTTENGGALDIISAQNGIFVPVKDPGKLGQAVIEALGRSWDKKAIQESAQKFNWTEIVANYKELYTSIMSS
jgi:glycosyltransferase involved in cell wall biosynthesis